MAIEFPTVAKGRFVGPVEEPERLRRRAEDGRRCLLPLDANVWIFEVDACVDACAWILPLLRELNCGFNDRGDEDTGGEKE